MLKCLKAEDLELKKYGNNGNEQLLSSVYQTYIVSQFRFHNLNIPVVSPIHLTQEVGIVQEVAQ